MRKQAGLGVTGTATAEDTRGRILHAVLEVIGEHGIAGLTNRRIAARAGVSLGSLTYHFTSQQELLREALDVFVDREVERIATLASRAGPLSLADAAVTAEQALGAMAADAGSIGVLELYLHAARDPSIRDSAGRCWEAYDRIARAILETLGVGEVATLAPQVVSLMAGTQLRWLATGQRPDGTLAESLLALAQATNRVPSEPGR